MSLISKRLLTEIDVSYSPWSEEMGQLRSIVWIFEAMNANIASVFHSDNRLERINFLLALGVTGEWRFLLVLIAFFFLFF